MKREVLRLDRVTLERDGAAQLANFNLHLFEGEIVGLIFVGGQGKRELVELLLDNTPLHYGTVYYREKMVNSYLHRAPATGGITLIDKTPRLVQGMTISDNVFVLRPHFKKYLLQPKVLDGQFERLVAEAGVPLRGGTLVRELTSFEKSVVQLLKAVMMGHRLIIVQDISNTVSAADLRRFHDLIRHFAAQGISFLYICSHHEEVFTLCGRAALVENGTVLRCLENQAQMEDWYGYLCWDTHRFGAPAGSVPGGGDALAFEGVSTANLHGVDFSMAAGECLVMLDANNTALEDFFPLLSGKLPYAGNLRLAGAALNPARRGPGQTVGFIPESPVQNMLFPEFSYIDNLCFLAGEKGTGMANRRIKRSIRQEYRALVGDDIDAANITELSQKSLYNLVYYGQHLYNPKLLVIMQPFYEADVYLRRHILFLIDQLRARKVAVLILAVNISDSPMVADRMLVLENGRVTREYGSEDMERINREKGL